MLAHIPTSLLVLLAAPLGLLAAPAPPAHDGSAPAPPAHDGSAPAFPTHDGSAPVFPTHDGPAPALPTHDGPTHDTSGGANLPLAIPVTFNLAAGQSYIVNVMPANQRTPTNHVESVTSISAGGRAGSFACTAYGVDGSVTQVASGQQYVPVGPPQTQVSIQCASVPQK